MSEKENLREERPKVFTSSLILIPMCQNVYNLTMSYPYERPYFYAFGGQDGTSKDINRVHLRIFLVLLLTLLVNFSIVSFSNNVFLEQLRT